MPPAHKLLLTTFLLLALNSCTGNSPGPIAVTEDPSAVGTPIDYGDTVTDELTATRPFRDYRFDAKAGDVIAFTMTSSDLDSYLQFSDAQGIPLAAADDGAGALNARLGPIQIPADGSYRVVAESFGNVLAIDRKVETGKFKLLVQKFEPKTIDYPGTAEGTLSVDEPLQAYKVAANAGDVVVARMRSEDVDSFLILSQADKINGLTVRNDDFGAGANAQIGPTIIPESGSYLLTATSASSNVQGDYKLSIDKLASKAIKYGDQLDDELSDSAPALVYRFDGKAGDRATAVVAGEGELDTMMTLLGPNGAQVAFNDDSYGHNPAIQGQALPSDGTYTLVVQPFAAGQTGTYHIEFDKAS